MRKPRRSARAGSVHTWVLLVLPVLIGVAAITIDGGRVMEQRRNDQVIADAAALAGASDLYANYASNQGKDPLGTAKNAAVQSAVANGASASAVTVNIPPTGGAYANQNGYIEVQISTSLGASFGKIFTQSDLEVSGRSVARGQPMQIGMILLRPSGADAFLNNALAFSLINSPVFVNSSDPAAFDQASVGAVAATRINVTGGFTNPGGALYLMTPVRTGTPPVPDPLAYLTAPDPSAATVQSTQPLVINSFLPTTLQPGVYQGGISISGFSTVTMNPGVYIMLGGGFQVQGSATVLGLETMVYNTFDTNHAAGPITITTSGKAVMSAPLSGPYQGIDFFQDRLQNTTIQMSGYGLAVISGVVYASAAPVALTGGAVVGVDTLGGAYVVSSATVNGAGAITLNLDGNPPRIPDVRLVE